MSHYGIDGDRLLAKNMPKDIKIDVILGGHSHIKMEREEIINGTKSLELAFTCMGQVQTIKISNIACSDELPPEEELPPVTTDSETYTRDYKGNQYAATESNGTYIYQINETHALAEGKKWGGVTLPKINYSQYTTVTFNWSVSGWTQFGYGADLWYYDRGTAMSGTVTLTHNGDGTMHFAITREGGNSHAATITDADVINGTKSLELAFLAYSSQTIRISNITCQ